MSEHKAHHQVEAGSERGFGLVFAAFFALVGLAPVLRGHGAIRWWALPPAAGFFIIALIAPRWLGPLNRVWFRFGQLLNRIVSPLIMGFFFFVVVTPLALVLRATGHDVLKIGPAAKRRASYWTERSHDAERPSSMRNQF
ncbi:SxtJ family membrane protein [Rhodoblastus sp.]|uniref:SxtJ family membrane protein n=1 Tax=Rhodoblastus sp. TaxID=1962975 RepID=UPI00260A1616|nr:SxtJ family membrane protein [Rhodoblastus sp.]